MPVKPKLPPGINPQIAQAFEGAHVFKLDGKEDPAKMEDQDLYFAHSICHAFYRNMSRAIKIAGWTQETLVVYYKKLVKEMVARAMIVVPTDDILGESIVDIVQVQVTEKELGTEDAGDVLTQPKIQGAKKKKPSEMRKVLDSTDPAEVMSKALVFFQKYDARSILSVLQIAEEAEMLKMMEEAPDAQAAEEETSDALNSGGPTNR